MSYSSMMPSPPSLPVNLSSSKFDNTVKEEELCQSAIKRHTIDAILGLPRLGGLCGEEEDLGDLEEEGGGKQKFGLDRDGE